MTDCEIKEQRRDTEGTMNNKQDEVEIDLLEVLFLFKKKILILLLAGLLAGSATGLFTHYLIQPVYSSTAKLYILSSSTSLTSLTDIQIGTSLTKDYIQLVQSRPVVEKVIENLKLNRTYEQLLGEMSFSNPTDTRILVITAENTDPVLAKDIVDEFVNVSKVSIAEIMKTEEPSIAELGYIAESPVSPNLRKNIAIGAFLGIFAAAVVVLVIYLLDDTVKSSEDIEKYLGLNTLTVIPLRENEENGKHKKFSGKKGKNISQKSTEQGGKHGK